MLVANEVVTLGKRKHSIRNVWRWDKQPIYEFSQNAISTSIVLGLLIAVVCKADTVEPSYSTTLM